MIFVINAYQQEHVSNHFEVKSAEMLDCTKHADVSEANFKPIV